FAEVAASLAGPQQRTRWALWVDDIHLLDTTSVLLLQQLLDAGVIRLICTVRAGEPISEAVAALCYRDVVRQIDVTVFDHESVEEVLQTALGGPIERQTLRELYSASEGNILYVRELVLSALASGNLTTDGEIWELTGDRPVGTSKLIEVIEARLAVAEMEARPVLELLALCGSISLSDAQALAPVEVLINLEQAGLVRVNAEWRRTTMHLAHPLYGEVLREQIPHLRRRAMLLEQAERVESYGPRRRDDALQVATRRLAATGTADPALLVKAANLARHATDVQQVLTLMSAMPSDARTAATLLLHGEALALLGRWQEAEDILAQADAMSDNEQDRLAVMSMRVRNFFWIARRTDAAFAVVDAARDRVTSPPGRRVVDLNDAWVRYLVEVPTPGMPLLSELEDDPADSLDAGTWDMAATTKTIALVRLGRCLKGAEWALRAYTGQSRDVNAGRSHSVPAASQLVPAIRAFADAGRFRENLNVGEGALTELTNARASPFPSMGIASYLGRSELLAGHPKAARSWYAEAASLTRAYRFHHLLPETLSGLACAAALLGDQEAAEDALAEAATYAPMTHLHGEDRLGRAWLLVARGQLAEARQSLTEGAEVAREAGNLPAEALLLTDLARLGAATEATPRLGELAEQSEGALTPARAAFAAALASNSPDQLLAAADELETMGADLLAAEAANAAGAALTQAGEDRLATAAAQRAAGLAARCEGARTPLLNVGKLTQPLTPRQYEIALLAASLRSNSDIAKQLHVTVKTVEVHLGAVFRKLGISRRQELPRALGQIESPPATRPRGRR
ncbi:helix-turn-helix transcriptional regulator, partial [Streptomyces zhihengii]